MADKYTFDFPEETMKQIAAESSKNFDRYVSQREEIDEVLAQSDYMYTCAANRTLASSEKSKGMNLEKDNRANVGSHIFHRQVNTLAGLLYSVLRSRPDFAEYGWYGKESADSEDRALGAKYLARWIRKQDSVDARLPEFCVQIFKQSNVFMQIYWKRTFAEQTIMVPTIEETQQEDGTITTNVTGENPVKVSVVKDNYPCLRFIPHDMIYADRYIPNINDQNVVIILSLRNKTAIYGDVASGQFDEEQYKKLGDDEQWDGNFCSELQQDEADNRNQDYQPSGVPVFLQWDVYIRAPVDPKARKWDNENPPLLFWWTAIGNTLGDAITMRIERANESDPDDEIPVKDIHASPDRAEQLYHTTLSEIVRGAYSADSTLLGLALDNMALVNDPPLMIRDGFHRIRDFRFIKGQRWHVDDPSAVTQFQSRDVTGQTTNLRQQVQSDIKSALATDDNIMGEAMGGRTSASEALSVTSATKQPHLMQIGYIINQMLPWISKKWMRYMQTYATPEQVVQITDEDKTYEIVPKEIYGEFDVNISILDEFEDDMMKQQQAQNLLQVIGSVPALQQSQYHTTDMGEILKVLMESMKWPTDKIIKPAQGVDSEIVARDENKLLLSGTYVPPRPGENIEVHLRIHNGERLRWKGIEDSNDPRASNLSLLDQHIEETKASMQKSTGTPAAPLANETPGEVVGNSAAATLGAAQPQ